jgi:hypothetical protein
VIRALFRFGVVLPLLLMALLVCAQEADVPRSHGALERWSYDASTHELHLQGWSLGGREGRAPPKLVLDFGGELYKSDDGVANWTLRVDIPSDHPATGGQRGVGFDWRVHLRGVLRAGAYPVRLAVVFDDDQRITLQGAYAEPAVVVVKGNERRLRIVLVLVVLGIIVVARGRSRWSSVGRSLQRGLTGNRVLWGTGAIFAVLVALGVTGSSMGVLFQSTYGSSVLDVRGTSRAALGNESVRGDEWGVQLPNLLAQWHHEPRFPVVNDFLGEGGQNMGVVGMTGVPVRQWAALARPATWGYFVLPLRQAMAWHWQLPFWGCLVALWFMLNVWRPKQRGLNLALSFSFCVAPYAAAWSNWPLYATMFPAFAFVVTTHLLREARAWRGVLMGACLGWLLACWGLVLYPTWIITVGSLMALIGLGWCIDYRKHLRFGMVQLLALVTCGAVLTALMGSWWLDTKDAIALMRATEYPGGRGAIPGGDLGWWWHLRGYHGLESLRRTGPDSNPSEASSYLFLPLLTLVLIVLSLLRDRHTRWTLIGAAMFMLCYWMYTMVGIPISVARATLWGNMPTVRMDVGLGLLTALLLGLFGSVASVPRSKVTQIASLAVVLLSAGLVVLTLWHTPITFVPNAGSWALVVAMVVAISFICGWVLWGRLGSAVALTIWLYLLATLPFNPLRIAPSSVDLAEGHRSFVMAPKASVRTLVLNGDGIGAMAFAAVGVPVVNGVFYYPHRAMWARMGLKAEEWALVNRYQHLGFYAMNDVSDAQGYRLFLGSIDQVHVHVHPQRFDFSCAGATHVAAPAQWTDALTRNPSLSKLGSYQDVVWFSVQSSCQVV